MLKWLRKIKKGVVSSFLLAAMTVSNFQGAVCAQGMNLPAPQQLLGVSSQYSLPLMKGLKVNPKNPLQIDFIIDNGNQGQVSQEEAAKLIRYFLAGLTMSEKDLWVNLSPYESDRVIPEAVGKTDLGRDMLAQDYILKQLASSLTYPESETGKKYWQGMGTGAQAFNKVWIAPAIAKVYEHGTIALVHEAKLKAMLEKDYLACRQAGLAAQHAGAVTSDPAATAMRRAILPAIEQEINSGKNFAQLRQVYYSLIMAKWFKEKFKASFYKDYINRKKISNIDIHDPQAKDKIYDLYTQAFKQGVYNIIKTEQNGFKRTKRTYFSGGIEADVTPVFERTVVASDAALAAADKPIGPETLVSAGWQGAAAEEANPSRDNAVIVKDIGAELAVVCREELGYDLTQEERDRFAKDFLAFLASPRSEFRMPVGTGKKEFLVYVDRRDRSLRHNLVGPDIVDCDIVDKGRRIENDKGWAYNMVYRRVYDSDNMAIWKLNARLPGESRAQRVKREKAQRMDPKTQAAVEDILLELSRNMKADDYRKIVADRPLLETMIGNYLANPLDAQKYDFGGIQLNLGGTRDGHIYHDQTAQVIAISVKFKFVYYRHAERRFYSRGEYAESNIDGWQAGSQVSDKDDVGSPQEIQHPLVHDLAMEIQRLKRNPANGIRRIDYLELERLLTAEFAKDPASAKVKLPGVKGEMWLRRESANLWSIGFDTNIGIIGYREDKRLFYSFPLDAKEDRDGHAPGAEISAAAYGGDKQDVDSTTMDNIKVHALSSEVRETFQSSMDDSPIHYGYVKPGTRDLDHERNQQIWVDFGKDLKRMVQAKRGRCAIFLPAERWDGTSWEGPACTVSLEVISQPREGVLELLLIRQAGKAYRQSIEFDSINDKIISRGKQMSGIGAPAAPHAKVLYEKMIDAGNAVGADVDIGSVLENRSGVLVTLANGLDLHYDCSKVDDHLVITSPAASDTPWVKVVRDEDGGGRAFRLKQTVVDITVLQAGGEFTYKKFYDGDSLDRPSEEIKTSCRIVDVRAEKGKIVIVLDGIKDEKIDDHFFQEMEKACPGIRFVAFDRKEGIDRNRAWSIAQEILGEIKRNQANFQEHGEYRTLNVSSQCPEVNFDGHHRAFEWNQQWPYQLDVNLRQVSSMGDLRRNLESDLGYWYRRHLAELEDARAKRPKSMAAMRKGERQYRDAMDQGFVAALNIKKDERVLDVGTRLGNIAVVASRYSDHVVGIDISENMVEKAKKIHAGNKKISFKAGDIAGYVGKDDSIDVATAAYVLSGNLSFDRLAALNQLNKAVKVGGRIGIFDYSPEGGGDSMWSKEQWERFLTEAGFSNISVEHPRWIGPSGTPTADAEHFVIYAEKNQAIIADYAGKYRQVTPESDDPAGAQAETDLGGITMNGIKVKTSEGSLPVEFAAVGPEFFNTAMLKIISMQPINALAELAKK